ncbi:hypothetical protein NC653_011977 [Populus alba x Populus x berolinensis]|uniref:Uncharacterized protein n=2 Tax=Populus alba x Populus x berolinensis TaxID=444605 RepID=A0AAD6R4R9_9ROSI|nr:hypothetical protein NC653_011977 [Populus alba x Populus x berolinensis]
MIVLLRRESDGEAQIMQKNENLMEVLILEKEKNFKLKMVVENINAMSSDASIDSASSTVQILLQCY